MAVPLDQIPASVLKSWAALADDPIETRGWGIVVLSGVLGAVCVAVVACRLWLRGVVQRQADLSDWFTLLALIFTLAFLVVACLTVKYYGMDHHVYNLTVPQIETLTKILLVAVGLTHFAEGFVRLSILLFYRNLLRKHIRPLFTYILWTVFTIAVLATVSSFIAIFFACVPLHAFWNQYNPLWEPPYPYTCSNHGVYLIATSAIGAVLDVVVSLLPIPVLWNLQISARQKWAIWGLFSMGIMACVAAMLRIYYCVVAFYQTYDFTWAAYGIILWTCIECPIGLIGCSLPALRALFARWLDHHKQSRKTQHKRKPRPAHNSHSLSDFTRTPQWLSLKSKEKLAYEGSGEGKASSSASTADTLAGSGCRGWGIISKSVTISTEIEDIRETGRSMDVRKEEFAHKDDFV